MLQYHPKVGDVLMCRFPECLKEPEMIKTRPVIVVTKEHPGRPRLCTIVPLSTTEPKPMLAHHLRIAEASLPVSLRSVVHWAKCDMLYTFSLDRLERVKAGKNRATGERLYETGRISVEEIKALKIAILNALHINLESSAP